LASIQNSLSEPLPEGYEFFKVKNQLLTSERVISLFPNLPLTIYLVSPSGSVNKDLSSLLEDK
jgi:hypothetical protein